MVTENASSADNQQEMSSFLYYYTGFCAGEMSCSLLKLSNKKSKTEGVYYVPDLTVSNQDKSLLKEINNVLVGGEGIITGIKGGYNLSIRGKRKVRKAYLFFQKYPPVAGDLFFSKLKLVYSALLKLEGRTTYRRTYEEEIFLEEVRNKLRKLKISAIPVYKMPNKKFSKYAIGHYLAGVLDGDGSVGMKKSGSKYGQPFVAVAMRDKKIVELFKTFLKVGHIHNRPKEKMIHFEIGSRKEVLTVLQIFLEKYPVKLPKMIRRIKDVKQILRDYTPRLGFKPGMI